MRERHAQYLVLDQGGHASRAIVYSARGRRLAQAECAILTRREAPDRVEHDGTQVLQSLREAIAAVLVHPAVRPQRLCAAGLSCQRASVLAWRRSSGEPITPVLSWADSRAASDIDALALDPGRVQQTTGVRVNPFFGASKLAWLRRHLPAVEKAAAAGDLAWGPLASFLLDRLLVERPYLCPYSIAQRSLLLDVGSGHWSPWLCARFGIEPASLPTCVPDLGRFGTLDCAGVTVPLRLCAGDQNLVPAAVATASPDTAVLNLGTGAFLIATVPVDIADTPLLRSVRPAAVHPPQWLLEGTVNGAGAAFAAWAQASGRHVAWSALGRHVGDDASALFLNRVGGLGSPWWQGEGSGLAFSPPPHNASEALAAIAESIAFLLRANVDAMRAAGLPLRRLLVGGGLGRSAALCQLIADACDCELLLLRERELSGRGAFELLRGPVAGPAPLPALRARVLPSSAQALRGRRYPRWLGLMGLSAS